MKNVPPTTHCDKDMQSKVREKFAYEGKVKDSDLSPYGRLILLTLNSFKNVSSGQCNPSISTLVKTTGMARRTLQSYMADLKTRGWINVLKVKGKDSSPYTSNWYILTYPQGGAAPASPRGTGGAALAIVGANHGMPEVQPLRPNMFFNNERISQRENLNRNNEIEKLGGILEVLVSKKAIAM